MFSLYAKHFNKDSLVHYATIYGKVLDSMVVAVETTRLQELQSFYDYSHYQQIAAKQTQKAERFRFWLILIIVVFIVILLIVYKILSTAKENTRRKIRELSTDYVFEMQNYQRIKAELSESRLQKESLSTECARLKAEYEKIAKEWTEKYAKGE